MKKKAQTHILVEGDPEFIKYMCKTTPICLTCRMELHQYIDEDGKKHRARVGYCDTTCRKIGKIYRGMFPFPF
jgi:hypothetical protein